MPGFSIDFEGYDPDDIAEDDPVPQDEPSQDERVEAASVAAIHPQDRLGLPLSPF